MRFILLLFLFSITLGCNAQDTITINIDCGNENSLFPWNNLGLPRTGALSNLIDDRGLPTPVGIRINDRFNGINNNGTPSPDPNLNLPATASGDSFFGNRDSFSNVIETTGGVLLTGLDTSKHYDLSLFASRLANDNRETQYNVSSITNDTLYLQVTNNRDTWASLSGIRPRQDGSIHIEATTGPNNTNTYGFFYLGAIRLQYTGRLDTLPRHLQLTAPRGGEYWQPGEQPEIRWKSRGNPIVRVEYSTNNGDTWMLIDSVYGAQGGLVWRVPNTPATECLVRLTSDTLSDQSEQPFLIASEDTSRCHILVLGSSTAAGTGPELRDSAWVWRYRDYLYQKDTRFRVTNLAKGGFTTYNILPTGTSIPDGINQSIDTSRNITRALQLDPDAIIINLPSNDAANAYPVDDQLQNYNDILARPQADSIPVWICTPQPRNFGANQIQIQLELRDSTFARFGDFAIDFWSGIADSTKRIDPPYDSGDGVHLNARGHYLLWQRILQARIDTFLLEEKITETTTPITNPHVALAELSLFPNPSTGKISVRYALPFLQKHRVFIVRQNGEVIHTIRLEKPATKKQSFQIELSNLLPGLYYCYLELEDLKRLVSPFVVTRGL